MKKILDIDTKYMKLALRLAKKGIGKVSPNPPVGAVLVKGDRIIGQGYHKQFGGPHAEIEAFNNVTEDVSDSILYITLEPCSTQGKTPPCTDAIISNGIKRVVIACNDPNPVHSGKGISILRKAGIEVTENVLREKGEELITSFSWYMNHEKPYVILKTAMSLDGKIATATGQSRWITGERSRKFVHRLRKEVDAVLVGVRTVIEDNPLLSSRLSQKKEIHPLKVVLDTRGEIPLKSKLLTPDYAKYTLVAISEKCPETVQKDIEYTGASTISVREVNAKLSLKDVLKKLGNMGISSILIEAGGELAASVIHDNIANKLFYFYAPKIIGGKTAPTALDGPGIDRITDAYPVKIEKIKKIGNDLLIEGTPCAMPPAPCVSEANNRTK